MQKITSFMTIVLVGVAALFTPGTASAIPIARLTLDSQPGDFIGQGRQFDIIYDSATDRVISHIFPRLRLAGGSTLLEWVLDSPLPGNQFSLVSFSTYGLGIPIQPGVYLDAKRTPLAGVGHPGMSIAFQNRGSNRLTGNFTIFDVSFTPSLDELLTFSASFEQHSEGATPALFGTFNYNAAGLTTVIAVPEPSTLILFGVGLAGFAWIGRRQRRA